MKLSGHLTTSVFRGYNIISGDDLAEAAALAARDSIVTVAETTQPAVNGNQRIC